MGIRATTKNDEYRQTGALSEVYSDFNHVFFPNPNTGQIPRKTNVDAVKMSIRNLLLTNKYERLRNPTFGSNIRRYLFESYSDRIEGELRDEIIQTIKNYEPRVRVIEVEVQSVPENNSIYIDIEFAVVTAKESTNLEIILNRVR